MQSHPDGNKYLLGLNTFGCNSTIFWNDDVWHFRSFVTGSHDLHPDNVRYIIYENDKKQQRTFNKDELRNEATRIIRT